MKKEWLKPQLMNLNINSTREDEIIDCPTDPNVGIETTNTCKPTNGNKKCNYPGCRHKALKHNDRCYCHLNQAVPGEGPYQDTMPGLDAGPVVSKS